MLGRGIPVAVPYQGHDNPVAGLRRNGFARAGRSVFPPTQPGDGQSRDANADRGTNYRDGGKTTVNLIAWIILGAIAGYLAGFLVRGDEGLGVIGHIVLGIVGAVVGGFLASALFNVKNPIEGALDLSTIVISVIGAVLVVVVVSLITGTRRVGRGPV
jgi:uncharacterized membrane protein YeaQ/YmgE (transglycosylase-associated protein family)